MALFHSNINLRYGIWFIRCYLGFIFYLVIGKVSRSQRPRGLRRGFSSLSFVGIVGSNSAGGMDVCLLWVLCFVRYRSLLRADHSSRGVLPTVVCLSVTVKPGHWGGLGLLGAIAPLGERICEGFDFPYNVIDWVCQWGSMESDIQFDFSENREHVMLLLYGDN
jgi:hypothetical protein